MNEFHRVSLKPRVFEQEFTDKVSKVYKLRFSRTSIATSGTYAIKFYKCNGDVYGYCADKTVRKSEGLLFPSVNFNSNVVPLIFSVTVDGVQKVMFVNDERAMLDGTTISGVPYGCSGALCGGRIFIADGYKLKYSNYLNHTNFTDGLNFDEFIEIEKSSGEILYLSEDAGCLYIVTVHDIFRLEPYGETYDFTMKKVSDFGLNILKNSVYGEGGRIGFISDNVFCSLVEGKIRILCDYFKTYGTVTVNSVAGGYGALYILGFNIGSVKHAFAYDYYLNQGVIEKINNDTIAGEYAVVNGDMRYYRVSVEHKEVTTADSFLGEYDFGTCAKKAICRIRAHISGNCTMTVTGEGTFTATITEQCNDLSCFVHGKSFNITFSNASSDFKLHKLEAHYVIYGE